MAFQISIVAADDPMASSVSVYGEDTHRITDAEADSFGVGSKKDRVKLAQKYSKHGGMVSHAYLYDKAEPFGKLYKKHKWEEVTTTITAAKAEVVEVSYQPVIISTQPFVNNSNKTATYTANVHTELETTVESNWYHERTVETNQSVTCTVNVLGMGEAGGSTSITHTESWGKGGSTSTTEVVGSDSGVTVELGPGEAVEARLTAMRGKMRVRVTYHARLGGRMAAAYMRGGPTTFDYGFESYLINDVLKKSKKPTLVTTTQEIELGYYSEIRVELVDKGGVTVQTINPSDVTDVQTQSA